jgi:SAM-dependent methyltransferase
MNSKNQFNREDWQSRTSHLTTNDLIIRVLDNPLIKFQNSIPAGSILDIGCGLGGMSLFYWKTGREVYALDKERYFLDHIQKMASTGIKTLNRNVPKEQLLEEEHALIIVRNVLHFQTLKECKETVQQAFNRLIDGGVLYLQAHTKTHAYADPSHPKHNKFSSFHDLIDLKKLVSEFELRDLYAKQDSSKLEKVECEIRGLDVTKEHFSDTAILILKKINSSFKFDALTDNKESKDEIFLSVVKKLAHIDDFYFNPDFDKESTIDQAEIEADCAKAVEKHLKFVEASEAILQLPSHSNKDYEYLIPRNTDNWTTKRYFRLYKYLQNKDSDFIQYQIKDAGILWGLFAYVDVESRKHQIKYLFGPKRNVKDASMLPNFLIRTFNIYDSLDGLKFIDKPISELKTLAEASALYRDHSEGYQDVDFVRMLQSKRKRTNFEIGQDIMYIPSGEMDCCILQWILLILRKKEQNFDLNSSFSLNLNDLTEISFQKNVNTRFDFVHDSGEFTIWEWLDKWGLIQLNGDDQSGIPSFKMLPRSKAMLYWMKIYLQSLFNHEKEKEVPIVFGEEEKYYWRILASKGEYEMQAFEKAYLFGIEDELRQTLIDKITSSASDEVLNDQFLNLLTLMMSWKESDNSNESWVSFQNRCRFSTYIHYVKRFGLKEDSNLKTGSATSGLLAMPILWDTVNDNREPIAFFMSIVAENLSNRNSEFKGSIFTSFNYNKQQFSARIAKLRVIVSLLGKVENIEIYQRGIAKKQASEKSMRESMFAATASVHTIKSTINARLNPICNRFIKELKNGVIHKKLEGTVNELENTRLMMLVEANIVNLINKLNQGQTLDKATIENSGLFAKVELSGGDVKLIANSVLKLFNNSGLNLPVKINWISPFRMSKNFLMIARFNLYPTKELYRILFQTAIENVSIHGDYGSKDYKELQISFQGNSLLFRNIAKRGRKYGNENRRKGIGATGNFYVLRILMRRLSSTDILIPQKVMKKGDWWQVEINANTKYL